MSTKVTFLEISVVPRALPLASGYMEAVCRRDAALADTCRFEKLSYPVGTPIDEIVGALERSDADVYAFSTYVWNARLVRRLRETIHAAKPRADVILGGPQVMHHAAKYLAPDEPNAFVCNGEGERTFAAFLKAARSPERDFFAVRGLSFYRDGELVTTEPESRIEDLGSIPSPFLDGVFPRDAYNYVLFETTRGCPFKCNYCYWGAATGAKVHQYDVSRLEQEVEWISRSTGLYLFIVDANFGMLKRDVDLARLIVSARKRHGAPLTVAFCASKNTPERVAVINGIFHDAGLLSCQSVALQTTNPETLARVDRQNIKTSAYIHLQDALNRQGSSSYVEMIWPLPGETLTSFQKGISDLCTMGADTFVVYPLLLINNVELVGKRDEYGIVTVPDPDPNSEAEIVVQTREVDRVAYEEGLRYVYAVTALYSARGLRSLASHLHAARTLSYRELFCAFVEFVRHRRGDPWHAFCERSLRNLEQGNLFWQGELLHIMLHAHREAFDRLLEEFVRAQPFWRDEQAQCLFEIDLVNRPYAYSNTPIAPKRFRFRHLRRAEPTTHGYRVELPPALSRLVREYVSPNAGADAATSFSVEVHRRCQMPLMPHKPLKDNYVYCNYIWHHMRDLAPAWRPVDVRSLAVS